MSQEFQMNQQEHKTEEIHAEVTKAFSVENRLAYQTLLGMHTYKRPAGSRTEKRFINRYLIPLGLMQDTFGNYFKKIGDNPSVMWSCHTDTVHTHKGMQRIGWDKNEIGVAEKDGSNCLGADDGAGLWLMQQMILDKKEGWYFFHRAEEIGRKGSLHVAKNFASIFKDYQEAMKAIKFAIALDRREKGSIITHQSGARGCSEAFSKSLAAELALGGMDGYKSDDTGSYTDTYSYFDLIGECTNLSVGYKAPHTYCERLDVDYIFKLRDALLKLDPAKLDVVRKAGDKEFKSYTYYGSNSTYVPPFKPNLYEDEKGEYFYRGGRRYNVVAAEKDEWWGDEPGYMSGTETTHNATGRSVIPFSGGTKSGTQVGTGAKSATTKFAEGDNASLDAAIMEAEKRESKGRPAVDRFANVPDTDPDEDVPMSENEFKAMTQLVKDHPDIIADLLEQFGLDLNGLQDEIAAAFGCTR